MGVRGVVHFVLFPLLELHDLWAGASGLFGSDGIRWSAVQGSLGLAPSLHIQHWVALARIAAARLG
jgi:hypothetical protein